jgi:hypothetical protein
MELIQNIIGDDTRFKFYQNSENKVVVLPKEDAPN